MKDKKAEIYNCGKELFTQKGFKDTNISEITKMAGVATGTFYNYYPSKDKLFMDIFMEENLKLKKEIMAAVNLEGHPADVIKEIMFLNFQGLTSNPILKEWYNKDVFRRIEQVYRAENGLDHFDFLYSFFIEMVKKWQDAGEMRKDIDAEMIMAIFTALITIDMHKEDIGVKYFPQIQEYLADFIMKGLMNGY